MWVQLPASVCNERAEKSGYKWDHTRRDSMIFDAYCDGSDHDDYESGSSERS